MINRESAWGLLTEFTQSESLRKHALAVEACMRACSRKFASNSGNSEASALGLSEEDLWGIVGLVHDFDYEKYPSLEDHPYKGSEILKERGWPEVIRRAIMSHAEYTSVALNLHQGIRPRPLQHQDLDIADLGLPKLRSSQRPIVRKKSRSG